VEVSCEVGIDEAFEAFGSVGSVVDALVLVAEKVANDAFGSRFMKVFGLGRKASALMNCVDEVWSSCAGEVGEHADETSVAPILFAVESIVVCVKLCTDVCWSSVTSGACVSWSQSDC